MNTRVVGWSNRLARLGRPIGNAAQFQTAFPWGCLTVGAGSLPILQTVSPGYLFLLREFVGILDWYKYEITFCIFYRLAGGICFDLHSVGVFCWLFLFGA